MATVSSTIITNRLGTSVTYNNIAEEGTGKVRCYTGTMSVATTSLDEIGDVIVMFPIRGSSRVLSLIMYNDDLDSNATPLLAADVGLYKDVSSDGTSATVVDADAYASGIGTFQAANTAGVEVAYEARNITAAGRTVAADGGESEHNDMRYVALTVTVFANTAAAGDISWVALVSEP